MPASQGAYWRKTLRLTAFLLVVWFVAGFVIVFNARALSFSFFGWPFSFYMAAQGSMLVFVGIVWLYARCMDRLDEVHRQTPGDSL